jgi:phage terminase large subunit
LAKPVSDKIKFWREHPDIFVREVFGATPDPWQDEVLKAFPSKQRIAMCASRGPGKSCCLAWLAWNFLVTRPHPKIVATSISGDNLRDGLWTELAKWREKSPLLKSTFVWQKERIFAKEYSETWWMSARQWAKSADLSALGNTLAGFHEDYVLAILDESGGMPNQILDSAEAALSSCKEGHIVQAGNPTHVEGPLYRACKTPERKLWYVVEINGDPDDPKRSTRVNLQWAREQIEKFGRDNPWVIVNVFGRFPEHSFNSLLSLEEVQAAINRRYRDEEFHRFPKIIGVDVARFGDDSSVLFPRQGLQAFDPWQYRNLDGTQGAEVTVRKWNEFQTDACFIDNTGGYGASWIDNLIRLGKAPIGVHFSEKSSDPQYYNKRTEMAFLLANWIKQGGAIPNIRELTEALVQTTYNFRNEKLLLEEKEDIKETLGYSPDHMDALMLTFAFPVEKSDNISTTIGKHQINYDPFSRDRVSNDNQYIYDPRN